jgi:hypothetical protein
MLLTVVVSSRHTSLPTPAHCCHCGRTDSFVPGETELLTAAGWQAVCRQCEARLHLPRVSLHHPLARLYSLAEWIVLN